MVWAWFFHMANLAIYGVFLGAMGPGPGGKECTVKPPGEGGGAQWAQEAICLVLCTRYYVHIVCFFARQPEVANYRVVIFFKNNFILGQGIVKLTLFFRSCGWPQRIFICHV